MPPQGPEVPIWDLWLWNDKAPKLAPGPLVPPRFNLLRIPPGPTSR